MKSVVVAVLLLGCQSFASILPDLHISVVPKNPVFIAYGAVTIDNHTSKAPLYIINSLVLSWTGKHDLIVDSVTLAQEDVANPVNCAFTGEELGQLYPALQNNVNQTLIHVNSQSVSSRPFVCEGLKIPAVVPANFDVPVKITVSGYEVQDGAQPTPVVAVEHIHLQ